MGGDWELAYKDIEERKANKKQWQQENLDKWKFYRFKHRYKITEEQYYELIKDGCAVCGSFEKLHIDHDHDCCPVLPTCGECIRGVLCQYCNHACGQLNNNPERAERLAQYLREWENNGARRK